LRAGRLSVPLHLKILGLLLSVPRVTGLLKRAFAFGFSLCNVAFNRGNVSGEGFACVTAHPSVNAVWPKVEIASRKNTLHPFTFCRWHQRNRRFLCRNALKQKNLFAETGQFVISRLNPLRRRIYPLIRRLKLC
jgi:hypothetical protein